MTQHVKGIQAIHSFQSDLSDGCFRRDTEVRSILHSTWLRNKVKPFWRDICATLTKITGDNVLEDREFCQHGNLASICGTPKQNATQIHRNCSVSREMHHGVICRFIDRCSFEINDPSHSHIVLSLLYILHIYKTENKIIKKKASKHVTLPTCLPSTSMSAT